MAILADFAPRHALVLVYSLQVGVVRAVSLVHATRPECGERLHRLPMRVPARARCMAPHDCIRVKPCRPEL